MKEMDKFREMLNSEGIKWKDASCDGYLPITRTHFSYRGEHWSVIHGYGTYGGFNRIEKDKGLLELMSDAVNGGEPIGYLTAEETMMIVRGEQE